jgi:hypothetical protein
MESYRPFAPQTGTLERAPSHFTGPTAPTASPLDSASSWRGSSLDLRQPASGGEILLLTTHGPRRGVPQPTRALEGDATVTFPRADAQD